MGRHFSAAVLAGSYIIHLFQCLFVSAIVIGVSLLNRVDQDQTATYGTVLSRSILFSRK